MLQDWQLRPCVKPVDLGERVHSIRGPSPQPVNDSPLDLESKTEALHTACEHSVYIGRSEAAASRSLAHHRQSHGGKVIDLRLELRSVYPGAKQCLGSRASVRGVSESLALGLPDQDLDSCVFLANTGTYMYYYVV